MCTSNKSYSNLPVFVLLSAINVTTIGLLFIWTIYKTKNMM